MCEGATRWCAAACERECEGATATGACGAAAFCLEGCGVRMKVEEEVRGLAWRVSRRCMGACCARTERVAVPDFVEVTSAVTERDCVGEPELLLDVDRDAVSVLVLLGDPVLLLDVVRVTVDVLVWLGDAVPDLVDVGVAVLLLDTVRVAVDDRVELGEGVVLLERCMPRARVGREWCEVGRGQRRRSSIGARGRQPGPRRRRRVACVTPLTVTVAVDVLVVDGDGVTDRETDIVRVGVLVADDDGVPVLRGHAIRREEAAGL